jgi:hypothetical protein
VKVCWLPLLSCFFKGPVSFSGADRVGISAFYQVQGKDCLTLVLHRFRELLASSDINDKIALGEEQSIQKTGGYFNKPRVEL